MERDEFFEKKKKNQTNRSSRVFFVPLPGLCAPRLCSPVRLGSDAGVLLLRPPPPAALPSPGGGGAPARLRAGLHRGVGRHLPVARHDCQVGLSIKTPCASSTFPLFLSKSDKKVSCIYRGMD